VATFVQAVNAFNDRNWRHLEKLLDENVVVYNISNVAYVIGRKKAMEYFENIRDPENFQPTNNISWFPSVYPLSVRGIALWTHQAHGHVNAPINYEFQFAPATFLLTSLWASHSS